MILSPHTIHALCRTLFHSLWIGLAVALLTGITITLTKRSSPKLRYNLFCGMFLLFVLATLLAFFWEWGTINLKHRPLNATVPQAATKFESWTGLLDHWSAWIVGVWVLCALLKCVKLAGELIYLHKIRHAVNMVSVYWQEKTSSFAAKISIRKNIQLLESALVRTPVTIGYFRPLILLPVGMLLQLSTEQVESILYHELAHILRRDFLVNILQSIVEAVFFFNPAVWWLSALIREEREACCDALVLTRVRKKSAYLEALMAFQQDYKPAKLAMGLSLRRAPVMNRLRRIVNQENQQLNAAEKIVLLAGFALLLLFTFVPKANQAAAKGTAFVSRQVVAVINQLSHAKPAEKLSIEHGQSTPKATKFVDTPQRISADTTRIINVHPKSLNAEPKSHPDETGFAAAKARARRIINALVDEKVVISRADIEWFGLSADELIVNGIKQPEALHQQFKAAFGIKPDDGVYYGPVKMNGKGDFLNKSDL